MADVFTALQWGPYPTRTSRSQLQPCEVSLHLLPQPFPSKVGTAPTLQALSLQRGLCASEVVDLGPVSNEGLLLYGTRWGDGVRGDLSEPHPPPAVSRLFLCDSFQQSIYSPVTQNISP